MRYNPSRCREGGTGYSQRKCIFLNEKLYYFSYMNTSVPPHIHSISDFIYIDGDISHCLNDVHDMGMVVIRHMPYYIRIKFKGDSHTPEINDDLIDKLTRLTALNFCFKQTHDESTDPAQIALNIKNKDPKNRLREFRTILFLNNGSHVIKDNISYETDVKNGIKTAAPKPKKRFILTEKNFVIIVILILLILKIIGFLLQ